MDGFASIGSAMVLEGIKVTPSTQCPTAIFCDTDILSRAPMIMTAAGLGDMLGKYTALADWKLSHILTGESMPPDVASIMKDALDKIVAGVPYLASRDPVVIQSVTEGLILSGIAMSIYGESRPASGSEHHLSHFWEMRMMFEGIKPALHAIKVGLGTIIGLFMWKELAGLLQQDELLSTNNVKTDKTGKNDYENNIRRLYGRSASAILETDNPDLPLDHILANKNAILEIAASLPSPEEVSAMLASVSAPVRPPEIELGDDTLRDSIIYARDRRKIYTLLQLLGDLGLLEDFANRVSRYFTSNALDGVKCFIFDMDGTIYLGNTIFPYTLPFLKHLKKADIDHIFFTNNSSQNAAHYINKLTKMGIEITPDKLMMSTHVLLNYLKKKDVIFAINDDNHSLSPDIQNEHKTPGLRVFVAGTKALRDDFSNAGYILTDIDPELVILGFDTDMDYQRLKKLCDFVRSGLPYYGVHTDYNCPVEDGLLPDCGALAAAVAASTGVTPDFFGKPSPYALEYIIQKTGYLENEICFIGDRLYTDIAISSGTKARSVLVLSGETKKCDLQGSKYVPDLIVRDLEELTSFIKINTD